MFKNVYQSGILSVFCSFGSDPLQLWITKCSHDGKIELGTDNEIVSSVLHITGEHIAENYILCPAWGTKTLGITLPYFNMLVKGMDRFFSFELQICDNTDQIRRIRISNYQSITRVYNDLCIIPLQLNSSWNHIQIDLNDITKKIYGSEYKEILRIQIHANCKLRRIWFNNQYMSENQLPIDFRLYYNPK